MMIFARVAERKSFSKAAADLNLSNGMATTVVKELERRHGVELIRRTTRSMALTAEGEAYYGQVRRILDDVAELDSSMASGQADISGRLVVQAPTAFSRIVLAPALGSFLGSNPHVAFTLLSRDAYPDMIKEGIDGLVYVGPLPDSQLVARSLGRFPILTVAAPDYLARHGTPKTPEDLNKYDLLDIVSATSGRSLEWRFKVNGRTRLRPVISNFRFESSEAAIAAAVGGAGVLQNISYALTDHIAAGRLRLLLAGWREDGPELHLVTRKYRLVPPRLRAFSSFLQKAVEERRRTDNAILAQSRSK